MKKITFSILLPIIIGIAICIFQSEITFGQAPDWFWAKSAGGNSYDYGYSIATDINGNVLVAGSYASSSITFGAFTFSNAGGKDIFLVKYDPNGNVIWAKSIGGTGYDEGSSVATDTNGNILITGNFAGSSIIFGTDTLTSSGGKDFYLVKYDPGGNVLWARSAGGTDSDLGTSVDADANGNILVTGYYMSYSITFGTFTLSNPSGFWDVFLVKYDPNGNVIWAKSAGGSIADYGISVATDTNGNVLVTGKFYSSAIQFGSYVLTNTNVGYANIFIAKYNPSGNALWAKSAGGSAEDYGYSVASDTNGNVLLTGSFESSSITFGTYTLTKVGGKDIYIVKYDSTGNVLWAQSIGGSADDYGYSVTTDVNGNIFITGGFYSSSITFGAYTLTNTGYNDIFIVKYDPDGNVLWAKNAGGTTWDDGASIATDANGNIFITGQFESSSITFGAYTFMNAGYNDVFISVLSSVVDIDELQSDNNEIHIYPNPVSDNIKISIQGKSKIEILNIEGQTIKTFFANNGITNISISDFAKGMYVVRVATDKGITVKKFIKE